MLTFGTLVAAFAFVVIERGTRAVVAEGSVAVDGPTLFMQGTILVLAFIAALVMAERQVDPAGDAFAPRASALPGSEEEQEFTRLGWFQTEVWPLFLFSVGGMLLFPASNDLLTMFVALEVLSLPLYVLAGLARRRRLLSQEASLKYFVLGAFSSAFFLYGTALLYGFAGTVDLGGIASALTASAGESGLVIAGTALLMVGLLFKIGAAPFHQWTPDVYQGSPTSITGFMAACTKVAAFGALLRVLYVALGGIRWDWRPVMYVIAGLTMIVGTLFALTQTDIKRMLAYSSIAQAGFMLVGVLATSAAGLAGTMVYLLAYGVATIGAFAIVTLVRDSHRRGDPPVLSGPGSARNRRWWPALSRCSCSRSPASRSPAASSASSRSSPRASRAAPRRSSSSVSWPAPSRRSSTSASSCSCSSASRPRTAARASSSRAASPRSPSPSPSRSRS